MKEITFIPQDVCSREIHVTLDNDIIVSLEAIGGCQGNLRGISALIKGLTIQEAITKLEGITCQGSRTGKTSCPDQIAKGLKNYLNK